MNRNTCIKVKKLCYTAQKNTHNETKDIHLCRQPIFNLS